VAVSQLKTMALTKIEDLYLALKGKSCFHAEAEVKPQDQFPFDKLSPLPGVDKVMFSTFRHFRECTLYKVFSIDIFLVLALILFSEQDLPNVN
jgi:hypothetical protein